MCEEERPRLRVIGGGRADVNSGRVRFAVATPEAALTVDAVVLEEDTWLILSAGVEVTTPVVHPVRLFTELCEAEPVVPGTVLIKWEQPLMLQAVVHDFGADPCCRREWIAAALGEILRICRERRVARLLLPFLGVRHGAMKPGEIVPFIIAAIQANPPPSLKTVYLSVPPGVRAEAGRLIAGGLGE